MPGDAGTAVVKIKTSIDWSGLNDLNTKITELEGKTHVIKIQTESSSAEKTISGLLENAKSLSKTKVTVKSSGAKDTAKQLKSAADSQKKLTSDSDQYTRTLTKQQNALVKIQKNLSSMSDAATGSAGSQEAYKNMKQQATNVKKLITQTKNGSVTLEQAEKRLTKYTDVANLAASTIGVNGEATNKIAKEAEKQANAQIKEQERVAKAAQKEAEKAAKAEAALRSFDRSESAEATKAQNALDSRRIQIAKELKNWTAAKNTKDYEALQKYSEALEDLNENEKNLDNGDLAKQFNDISDAAAKAETNIKLAGKDTLSFGDKFKQAFADLSKYITPAMVLRQGIQTVKQMAQNSMEIESAMNRIQIVTGSSDSQMTQFFNVASNQAQELGKSITDVAGSIEVFSRLGYSLSESTELSRYANIMANVGDTTVSEATTGITSIIKGFDLRASDAEHVSDVLIDVGQKYAISASELMQAFERGGAAMDASNTSFEQSAALFAATNASLQNASTTGTLWKAISARLRQSKTELEEMGEDTSDLAEGTSKYRDEILQLTGFDIQDAAGNFKNLYDIFTGLAQVWDNINGDQAQARVAEILGGTRNLSGVMSTINNIKDAMGAYETAMDSAGVAAQANDKYMETTAAHVGQFKAAFQELSYDTINGGLMKGIVDFGTGTVKAIDGVIDKVGSLSTALGALSALSLFKSARAGGGIKSLSDLGQIFSGSAGVLGPIAAITGAISIISGIHTAYKNYQEELRVSADKATDSYNSMEDSINSSLSRAKELRSELDSGTLTDQEAYAAKKELLDIQNQLAESYPKIADGINLVNGSMEQQVALTDKLLQSEAEQALAQNAKAFEEAEKYMNTPIDDVFAVGIPEASHITGKLQELAKSYKDVIDMVPDGNGGLNFAILGDNPQDAYDQLSSFASGVLKLRDSVKEGTAEYDYLTQVSRGAEVELKNLSKGLSDYSDRASDAQKFRLRTDNDPFGLPGKEDQRTALQWSKDYEEAINNLNDALLKGDASEIKDASAAFEAIDSTIQSLLSHSGMGKYSDIFSDIRSQLQEAMLTYNEFERAITGDVAAGGIDKLGKNSALYAAGQEVKELGLTATEIADTYIEVSNRTSRHMTRDEAKILDLVHAARELGVEVTDASGALTDSFLKALTDGEIAISDLTDQTEQAAMSLDNFSSYQSTLTSALSASASATGLTADQISNLKEVYENAGFDTSNLFEATANGVHLNQTELEQLNKTIEKQKLSDYAKSINEATEEYNKLLEAYKKGEEIDGKRVTDDQLKNARDRINNLKLEESQYEGLISAYNKWQLAQSQTDERANYEAVGSGYEGIKDLVEHGWINDSEVGAYLDLVLGKVDAIGDVAKRSGDNLADFAKLTETNAYGHNIIGDYWSYSEDGKLNPGGLETFLSDVNQFDSSIVSLGSDADGTNAVINFTGDNLARVSKEFGMSTEMIQLMERAMVDAGAAMVLDSDNISLMGHQMEKADLSASGLSDTLQETLSGYDWENIEGWDSDTLQSAINDLDEGIKQLGNDTEEARSQAELMRTTIESLQMQQIRTEVNAQIASGKSYDDLLGMSDEEIQATFHVEADGVDDVRAQIESLKEEAEAAKITVTIDEAQFSQLMGDGEEQEKHAKVVFEKDSSEVDGYQPEEKSATVRYGKDTSLPDGWHPQDKTATVTYTMNKPPVPSYPNISRTITYTISVRGSIGKGAASGTMLSVAHADGSMVNAPWNWIPAHAAGDVALKHNEVALTNELGQESIIISIVTLHSDVY